MPIITDFLILILILNVMPIITDFLIHTLIHVPGGKTLYKWDAHQKSASRFLPGGGEVI
ncbi:hypothetical protein CY34DRAFT_14695 [Suillus luteus UH-Slu-Lm8-n1]|uniref:Uncharacterized protein n=1 Tax=Suillus luteus UH-Slu-Lm8-n1 TaxID=930992 RepID=A0A0D0AB25_9AGAM|nr:hypothetical protein CY34DRAFT_14695 [Suillus luteus UH-Slu-Lm8-n1]